MNLFPYKADDTEKLEGIPWNISQVNAPSFWVKTRGEQGIVAIVDTGLDIKHPEFTGRIVGGYNFNGGRFDDLSDADGHGTHVAGIVAGATTGVAPNAWIMPLKVFGGSVNVGEAIKEAFRYILKWNKNHTEKMDKVIAVNCSFGSSIYDIEQGYLIRQLVDTGVTVCVAAGNQGDGKPDTQEVFNFPGYLYEVVTTGALNQDGTSASYSSSYDGIDIAAPGTQIYSTWPGGGYKLLSGTSMATPHITGTVALLYSAWVGINGTIPTAADIFWVLRRHIKKVDIDDKLVGNGVLDLTWDPKRWPWTTMLLNIDSKNIKVNGVEKQLDDQVPFIVPSSCRTVIPVHGVFEEFDISPLWVGELRQVSLYRRIETE